MELIIIRKKNARGSKNTFGMKKKMLEFRMLEFENAALKKSERLNFLNGILIQVPKIVDINCTNFNRNTKF